MDIKLAEKGMDRDQIELLVTVYRKEFDNSFPNIERLYKAFRYVWEEDSTEFLFANKDAFELEESDFVNIEERLEDFDLKVPSFEDIHRWLDVMKLTYMTETGEVIHSPVVSVW